MAAAPDESLIRPPLAEIAAAGIRIGGVEPASFATPPGLVRHVFDSMGTQVQLLTPAGAGNEPVALVERLFGEWHRRLTRFDPDSELSRLNEANGREIEVSVFLFAVVDASLQAAAATRGLFDPTMLHVIENLGYDRTFALVLPDDARPIVPGAQRVGSAWRRIRLDRERLTVTLPEGIGLDFGGIAKGMAADAAIARLVEMGSVPAAVDAGGDIVVSGAMPNADDGDAAAASDGDEPAVHASNASATWPISIELPRGSREVTLHGGALATSGVARRWWRRGGRRLHHLIDPRTGMPVENGLWSVSVAAARCEHAEVAAKAAFVLGIDAGAGFLEANGLVGLFVDEAGRQVEVGEWRTGSTAEAVTP